jgi:hypothetical protein
LALTLRSLADSFYVPFAAFMFALLLVRICAKLAARGARAAAAV